MINKIFYILLLIIIIGLMIAGYIAYSDIIQNIDILTNRVNNINGILNKGFDCDFK